MEISTEEQYWATKRLLDFMASLGIKSTRAGLSDFLSGWADVWERCGDCDKFQESCDCYHGADYDYGDFDEDWGMSQDDLAAAEKNSENQE